MDEQKRSDLFTIGTPACGALLAIVGAVLALMLIFIGFWKTLFVLALTAIGYLVGAVKNKSNLIKSIVNTVFPPKGE